MRDDRLVKLIDEYTENITARELSSADFGEKFANYLRANIGVVPPCNIGDTVYMITNGGSIRNLTVTQIDIKLRPNKTDVICRAVFELDGQPCEITIVPSKINEIYFFSLEDAEKALQHPRLDEQLAEAKQKASTVSPNQRTKENER